jgi:hypothetical protein
MSPRRSAVVTALVIALAASAPAARADQIPFAYNFSTPTAVTGDAGNFGTVAFAATNGGNATGPSASLIAASLSAISSAPASNPDTFSGETYSVTLSLTDTPSGKSGTLTFVGGLFGSLTATTENITTSFATATQKLVLGNDTYTVTIGPLVPQTPANPTLIGTLMAAVAVQAGVSGTPVSQTPEPTTLVLAVVGGLAGLVTRRRGRRA